MKRIISFLLIPVLIFTIILPHSVVDAKAETDVVRYTVLVLDTSGKADFIDSYGSVFYTADTAIEYVKQAASKFLDDVLNASGTNYVSVVSFKSSAQVVSDFSNNSSTLKNKVNGLYSNGTTRDISSGLSKANELLSKIDDAPNVIKNVVLFTTGMTNEGTYNYSGKYDKSTVGSNWIRTDTRINLYAYANHAISVADTLKKQATVYTIGLFKTFDNMPAYGKNVVEFFKLTAKDLATSSKYFYHVDDPNDLVFEFGQVVEDIINKTTPITFSYANGDHDYSAECYFDEEYFEESSFNYNSSLATMSICLALSAYNSFDNPSGVEKYEAADKNVKALLCDGLKMEKYEAHDNYFKQPTSNTIGVAAAQKKLKNSDYTLVAVAVRGGNYESEWASNFTIGKTGEATGFGQAKDTVVEFIEDYLADSGIKGKIKLWIVGYSRGGAVANMTAGAIDMGHIDIPSNITLDNEDMFAYCFETPMGAEKTQVKNALDRDPQIFDNIHNIINKSDAVPRVAMEDYGFTRFGSDHDHYLPYATNKNDKSYNEKKKLMLSFYENLQNSSLLGEYVVDSFKMKKMKINWSKFLPGGDPLIEVANDKDYDISQGIYLDNVLDIVISEQVQTRSEYVEELQNVVRVFFTAKYGTLFSDVSLEKMNEFLDLLIDRLTDWDVMEKLLASTVTDFFGSTQSIVEDVITECLNEVGLNNLSIGDLKDAVVYIVKMIVSLAVSHPNYTATLISNLNGFEGVSGGTFGAAHYGELTLSWLMSEDINYTNDPNENNGSGNYRIVRINCPVDVWVYNEDSVLISKIISDVPENSYDEDVTAAINSDGEKLIYIPVAGEYTIKLNATDNGTMTYSVNEYSAMEGTVNRIINYYSVIIQKGDTFTGFIPKYSEEEISRESENGSVANYTLKDPNNNYVKKDVEVCGKDAIESKYTVNLTVSDSNFGVAIGGGVYKLGNFAQVTANEFEDCQFVGWYIGEECVSTDKTYRFCVTKDYDIEARFSSSKQQIFAARELTLYYKHSSTVSPETQKDTIRYYSSNEDIVSVDQAGNIFANKIGTATITAIDHETGVENSCKVTVEYTWWQWLIRIFLLGFIWY